MPDILFPPGRMVGGNLDKLFPVMDKKTNQQRIGKDNLPMFDCAVACAIPKTQARWQDEFYDHPTLGRIAWGALVYQTGAAAHPDTILSPAFSWKITDGDSVIPNKKGKKPCDQTGYPGNWVLWFSQGWLPKRVNGDGLVELPVGSIVPGYYIQVFGSVAGNKMVPDGTPGVYLNPIAVALVGEGERLTVDVDTTKCGFGAAPLPAGAKPVTAAAPQFAAPAPHPVAAATPTTVVPNAAILNVAPPPPAAPVHQMTALAAGATYEQFVAQNWTDDMLRQHGYML